MISRFAQLLGLTPMQSLPAGNAPAIPIKSPVDQFVRKSESPLQPKFGKVLTANTIFWSSVILAGGAAVLTLSSELDSQDTLPFDAKVSQPAGRRVILEGEKPKPVTAEVVTHGVKFVFTGNVLNDAGEVDESRLAACVKKVLTGNDEVRKDIFQFNPGDDVVYCDLNQGNLSSWGVISNKSVEDLKSKS
jgi:hypothetical protein